MCRASAGVCSVQFLSDEELSWGRPRTLVIFFAAALPFTAARQSKDGSGRASLQSFAGDGQRVTECVASRTASMAPVRRHMQDKGADFQVGARRACTARRRVATHHTVGMPGQDLGRDRVRPIRNADRRHKHHPASRRCQAP